MIERYFIVNPKAKNGQCLRVWGEVEKHLQKLGIAYKVYFTEYAGQATQIASTIISATSNQSIFIVVVGGDGTLHEVANGVAGHLNVSLGFIPGGSGNDFSRGFEIPRSPIEALETILKKHELRVIDTGRVRTKESEAYFVNNMGVGFDAAICKSANQSKLKAKLNSVSLGGLVYVLILLKLLFTYKCTKMTIFIDGQKREFANVWFATIANQVYFGGGMKIAPHALPMDGELDVIVVHNLSRWKLLLVFASVFWGGHTNFKEVHFYKGKKISIQTENQVVIHADGEVIGTTPINIEVVENSLHILAGKSED
ncbi:diacylglycerol kinase family lipid kinase [Mesobacillus maritimus]|uniref:diacylglycerol/lipid kinase family protein n=1 Tax=Mesobacillus maritimus TaxID=1643336 RepID=UPI00203B314E|nr:diacylglycerol kinase family protein [Mesobacillus maritimus]MCM3587925.1 diacylglycerol kinase family lipid kinase [Mesobacillus maritimus]